VIGLHDDGGSTFDKNFNTFGTVPSDSSEDCRVTTLWENEIKRMMDRDSDAVGRCRTSSN
jgi:hypothetical protein